MMETATKTAVELASDAESAVKVDPVPDPSAHPIDRPALIIEAAALETSIVADTVAVVDRDDKLAEWCAIGRQVIRLAQIRKELAGCVKGTGVPHWRGTGKDNDWKPLHEGLRFKIQEVCAIPDSLRMDTCARMAAWVDTTKLAMHLPSDRVSYNLVKDHFLPTYDFDPTELTGAVRKGWEIWTAETVTALASDTPPTPPHVKASRLAHEQKLKEEALARLDPEKRIQAEREAKTSEHKAKVNGVKHALRHSVQDAIESGIVPSADIIATIIDASKDVKGHLTPLSASFIINPGKATPDDILALVNALTHADNIVAIKAMRRLSNEVLTDFKQRVKVKPPTKEELAIAATQRQAEPLKAAG